MVFFCLMCGKFLYGVFLVIWLLEIKAEIVLFKYRWMGLDDKNHVECFWYWNYGWQVRLFQGLTLLAVPNLPVNWFFLCCCIFFLSFTFEMVMMIFTFVSCLNFFFTNIDLYAYFVNYGPWHFRVLNNTMLEACENSKYCFINLVNLMLYSHVDRRRVYLELVKKRSVARKCRISSRALWMKSLQCSSKTMKEIQSYAKRILTWLPSWNFSVISMLFVNRFENF